MNDMTVWSILAAVLIGIEMLTGTFYLLMLSVGAIMAVLAAWMGASTPVQIVLAALVSTLFVLGWYLLQRKRRAAQAMQRSPDDNATRNSLDIGETVLVQHWNDMGTASVQYRGANWSAVAVADAPLQTGRHTVVDIRNNQLVLRPAPLAAPEAA